MNKFLAGLLFACVAPLCLLSVPAADPPPVKPFNVPLNTEADEDEPHVADLNLTLYYTSKTDGKVECMVARRRSIRFPWPNTAEVLEDYIRTKVDGGTFATQGPYPHYLYYGTREEKAKNHDLYVAVKQDTGKAWTAPTPVMNVNTPADEMHPWLTADGKSLYFSRKTREGWRQYVTTRPGNTGPGGWGEPIALDLPVGFHHATLTPDGKTMYLQGPLEKGRWGLFTSTREGDGWSKPEPLTLLNSSGKVGDRSPNLTRDGLRLYWASDRTEGSKGGFDVWGILLSSLPKKKP